MTEDSGLHDIRNLAQSTKQRLSSRRSTSNPVVRDEDLVATSSAGWKAAVALPEPAKMVSLPELDELPSKKEVLAKDRADKAEKVEKVEKTARVHAEAAPAVTPVVEIRQPFSRPTPKKSRSALAVVGVLAAAAAGVAVYFTVFDKSTADKSATARGADQVAIAQPAPQAAPQAAPTGTTASAEVPPPAQVAPIEPAEPTGKDGDNASGRADEGKAADTATTPPNVTKTPPAKRAGYKTKGGGGKEVVDKMVTKPDPAPADKIEVKKDTGKKAGKGGEEGEPNFDDLLKEAGVDPNKKKVAAPKLANKELSGDDFKRGMGAIAGKAQGCYHGTQGTAAFKLTVAPSGHVSKVVVTGLFAGKPEGDCVVKAVQGATFPPWDGGPQTFTYSYLLAE